jgi:hypothetical protein
MKRMLFALVLALSTAPLYAHCDWVKGPVVAAAKSALESGNIAPVLRWIPAENEPEIRAAFQRTLAVRGAGGESKELADQWFYETLVRVHRASEGEPYTGLKDASYVPEAGIELADVAIEKGSADELVKMLTSGLAEGVRTRFAALQKAKEHADHNPAAGRAWVASYVEFIHYVERIHGDLAKNAAHQHEH